VLAHSLHLLVVSDDPEDGRLIEQLAASGLRGTEVAVKRIGDIGEALPAIENGGYDLLILDARIGDTSGLAVLGAAKRNPADTPIIFLTDDGDDETAVAAMRAGAADYLVKSRVSADLLRNAIRYAFDRRDTERLRLRAEQALRDSERRYRLLMEHASDGILIFDRGGQLLTVNSRACEMLGYEREELLRLSICQLIVADGEGRATAFLDLAEGQTEIGERLYRRKDGTAIPVEISARGLEDGAIQGIVRDITERKRVEDALRRSEERFRTVARATNDTVWDWDITTDHLWWNEGMQLQFRFAADEIGSELGWWKGRLHPEDAAKVVAGVQQALDGGEQFWWDEYRFKRGDATYAYIFDRGYIVRDESGRAVRMIGAMMDVTERRQSEEALRASEEEYRALFDTNPLPLWVLDPDDLRFLAVNQAAVRHYGYSAEQFLDMTLGDLVAPQARLELMSLREQVGSATGSAATGAAGSAVHQRADGSRLHVELTANKLNFRGRPALLLLANDVTERRRGEDNLRQSEEQLRQWQKIEAVGRLAGGIAHDFNNMINVISGYGQMLARRLSGDDVARRNLDEILKACDRAGALTRQLLTFSRKQPSEPQLVDLNDVVGGMSDMLRRLIGEDVELGLITDPGLSPLKANRGQIEQILVNLVVNARDAMPEGGQVTIRTENVELDTAYARTRVGVQAGPHVMLLVRDSGMGMDSTVLAHLFEPFFTTKPPGRGTGLGLATAYGMVKQAGGHIVVESDPGAGSTFRIYWPVAERAEAARPEPVAPVLAKAGSETILLVEDESYVRAFMCESLRALGYQVIEAAGGAEALLYCRRHPDQAIDLLLTDVVMPKMNGPELALRVRELQPHMRVLYVSGYTENLPAACTPVLHKPFTADQLGASLREVLETAR
jgi:PAS domain S-box-containing protein